MTARRWTLITWAGGDLHSAIKEIRAPGNSTWEERMAGRAWQRSIERNREAEEREAEEEREELEAYAKQLCPETPSCYRVPEPGEQWEHPDYISWLRLIHEACDHAHHNDEPSAVPMA